MNTPTLTIDSQPASEYCPTCKFEYPVSRGSVYEAGRPIAIYLAGMHACEKGGSAILAIAFRGAGGSPPRAATVQVWSVGDEFQMSILEPSRSPWAAHAYLGRMVSRLEALEPSFNGPLFQVADTILYENPDVRSFFARLHRSSGETPDGT